MDQMQFILIETRINWSWIKNDNLGGEYEIHNHNHVCQNENLLLFFEVGMRII